MNLFDNNYKLSAKEYFDLTEYIEEALYVKNLDIVYREQEGNLSTRFDLSNDTSIWITNKEISGTQYKSDKKELTEIVNNSPIPLENHLSFV